MITDGEDQHALRMFLFASHCVQLFSGRYKHPDASALLESVAARSALVRRHHRNRLTSKMSGSTTSSTTRAAQLQSRCAMRYGIALGPVTVGVLPGKCPVFDVWGKTVNLASRMEVPMCCLFCFVVIWTAVARSD